MLEENFIVLMSAAMADLGERESGTIERYIDKNQQCILSKIFAHCGQFFIV